MQDDSEYYVKFCEFYQRLFTYPLMFTLGKSYVRSCLVLINQSSEMF
jgi:hypothetical protein